MFTNHVSKQLSAYCHGELSARDQTRVARHLEGCARCKTELEEIRLGIKLAECLPPSTAPESLWGDIERSLDATRIRPSRRPLHLGWKPFAVVSALLIVGLVLGIGFYVLRDSTGPWEVIAVGAVRLGSDQVTGRGMLGVGEHLETTGDSRATIRVGLIGEVEVDPNTRLRLIEARFNEYRLSLERGRVHASISAPPRLFFIDTPSAVAVDLGCSYTLEVNELGEGLLRVTGGAVQLVLNGRESMVPPRALCATVPGIGPGTPYFEDSSQALQHALRIVDFEASSDSVRSDALSTVLSESRKKDSLTLWHLLRRVSFEEREKVYDLLVELVPLPDDVTREGVMALDEEMLNSWYLNVQISWF